MQLPRVAKSPWTWAGSLALVALYAAAGFWLVPRLVQSAVRDTFAERWHRSVALGEVAFNPFTFELEARAFAAPDADGAPLLAFDRLYVDLELASLFRRGLVFRAIELDRPYVRAERRADGAFNLADLATPAGDAPPAAEGAEPAALPRVWIGDLTVREGRVDGADLARAQPLRASFSPVTFRLLDFGTASDGNAYTLNATSTRGERFAWRGTFGLRPLASDGTFELAQVRATTLAEAIGDSLPFAITRGVIGLRGSYALREVGGRAATKATLAELVVADLGVRPRGESQDWVSVPRLAVGDTQVDLAARSVRVGTVAVERPSLVGWLDRDGVNLARLAGGPPPESRGAEAPSASTVVATASASGSPAASPSAPTPASAPVQAPATAPAWTLAVPDVRITGASVDFEDRVGAKTPARFRLAPLDVAIAGYSLPAAGPLRVDVNATVNGTGTIAARGDVALAPLAATFDVDARALDLVAAQPYVASRTAMRLLGGSANARGRVGYAADGAVTFTGDASVDRLRTIDDALEQDFVRWRSLALSGIDLRTAPLALRIREVVARQPYFRVIVASDQTLNLTAVLAPEAAAAARLERERASAQAAMQRPATKDTRRSRARSRTPPAAAPAPPSPPARALPIEIGLVRILDGSTNFADYSIRPQFATGIEQLSGTIRGLSGRADARADVRLEGKVDRYAPVTITGKVNYFAAVTHTDLKLAFRNMELTTFSPYSGKFAGYRIDKGKLSVDLNYLVENRKLDAKHRIVIDQLQLGERVESADATKLPVRLAIALLKDRNGVIDLDLPVTGSLDDPKFRLGPIIWKVVVNLVTKAVTAPFALLGALFGGGEDMQYLDFAPGAATLDDANRAKLAQLVKALDARPGLALDVPMVVRPASDRDALVARRWDEQLRAAAAQSLGRRADEPGAAAALLADRERYLELLTRLYRSQTGAKPEIPKPPAPPEGAAPVDRTTHAIAWLEGALKPRIAVTDAELATLAKERAQAVQSGLLDGTGIDPSRVFVVQGAPLEGDAPTVRLQLALR